MYIMIAVPICLQLERQAVWRALSRAWAKTGKRIAAKIAMIAITMRSSMRVNAHCLALFFIMDLLSLPDDFGATTSFSSFCCLLGLAMSGIQPRQPAHQLLVPRHPPQPHLQVRLLPPVVAEPLPGHE